MRRTEPGRWWEAPVLMGLAVSLFLHMLVAMGTMMVIFGSPPDGEIGDDQAIELAVMSDMELTELTMVDSSGARQFTEDLVDERPTFEMEDLSAPLANLDDFTRDLTIVTSLTSAGESESGASDGSGPSDVSLTSAVGASFFGVEARGSRFAFIIDVSYSMEGDRIAALETALLASIEELTSDARFSIILYSEFADELTGRGWTRANDRGKAEAKRKLAAIRAHGKTNPIPALKIALEHKPRPDAIYFMTDGQFDDVVESRLRSAVARMTRSPSTRVPMHCITFVERSSEILMRQIARQTGGSYTHVEGSR